MGGRAFFDIYGLALAAGIAFTALPGVVSAEPDPCQSLGLNSNQLAHEIVMDLERSADDELLENQFEIPRSFSDLPRRETLFLLNPETALQTYKQKMDEAENIGSRIFWRIPYYAVKPAELIVRYSSRLGEKIGYGNQAAPAEVLIRHIAQGEAATQNPFIQSPQMLACQESVAFLIRRSGAIDGLKAGGASALFVVETFLIPRYVAGKIASEVVKAGIFTAEEATALRWRYLLTKQRAIWRAALNLGRDMYEGARKDVWESSAKLKAVKKYWPIALLAGVVFHVVKPMMGSFTQLIEQEGTRAANQILLGELEAHYEWLMDRQTNQTEFTFTQNIERWNTLARAVHARIQEVPTEGRFVDLDNIRYYPTRYLELLTGLENQVDINEVKILEIEKAWAAEKRVHPHATLSASRQSMLDTSREKIRFAREKQYFVLVQWAYYWAMYPELRTEITRFMKTFGFFAFGSRYGEVLQNEIRALKDPDSEALIKMLQSEVAARGDLLPTAPPLKRSLIAHK